MATMLDVSRRAGVSKSTVSRVLNGKGRISAATRQAVFKAIEELDYRPDIIAQSLSNQATNTIGLIIPRGYNMSKYITELIDVVQEMANQAGKFLMITQVDTDDVSHGIKTIRNLADRRCDGILYYKSSHIESDDVQEQLEKLIDDLPIPLVVLNYHLPNKPDYCVWYDHVETGRLAVDHLIENGHSRIAYISGSLNLQTARQRLQAYQESLKQAGIDFDPLLMIEGDGNYSGGYQACNQLIQRKLNFTAICCYNDVTAIGVAKALNEHGISVPDDVSIFGFDNEPVLDYTIPPISSVALPIENLVNHASRLLFSHMTEQQVSTQPLETIHGELVNRSSVKNLNQA